MSAQALAPTSCRTEGAKRINTQTFTTTGGRTTVPVEQLADPGGTFASFDTGAAGVVSVGYGLRQRAPPRTGGQLPLQPESRSSGARVAREEKYGGMLNALFDLDVGSPYVYPYFGAGAGYSWVDQRATAFRASGFVRHGPAAWTAALPTRPSPACPSRSRLWSALSAHGLEYRFYGLAGDRTFGVRTDVQLRQHFSSAHRRAASPPPTTTTTA